MTGLAKGLKGKFACTAAFVVAIACVATFGIGSSARAATCVTGGESAPLTDCSGGSGATAWSVDVGAGITLVQDYFYTSSSSPAGPGNQGTCGTWPCTSNSGHLLGWLQNTSGIPGASGATEVGGADAGTPFAGPTTTLANVLALHYGGSGGKNEIVLVFSGATYFSDITLGSLSNYRLYNISQVPLPPAAFLFGTALVGMGILGRRRRRVRLAQA